MKKRILSLALALCFVLTLLPTAFADLPTSGTCGTNLTWVLKDGRLTISGKGAMYNYDYWNDYRAPWDDLLDQIEKVVIKNGVTSIGEDAFFWSDITSVTIPNSVSSIGDSAFNRCYMLENVTIPDSVKSIGDYAFCSDGGGLKSVTIGIGVTSIGEGAFYADELSTVNYNGTIKQWKKINIADENNYLTLAGIHCSDGTIAPYALGKCGDSLTWRFDNGVLTISGKGAMENYDFGIGAPWKYLLNQMDKVVIENGVTSIGEYAFKWCSLKSGITIPVSVTSIEYGAFYWCAVKDVYYAGTKAQWDAISIADGNVTPDGTGTLDEATIHYGVFARAPALKITTASGKPQIIWNSVDGAVKYWIYRSTDGKNFKYYDSTTKTSYTNKSTSIGTTYYYKVKAVNSDNAASAYSVVKSIQCKPAAPSVSIYRTNGKPQLKWNAVTGATKYWIYRSTDGVNFKYFDSTTKTSYTNSGAASGTKYYYRVKAVAVVNGNNVVSASSSTKSLMTTLATPSVSITTSNGKPKLTWKAVTGADKYYVYRSTDGKTFKYWDSTTKTTYINSGAAKNTKYYYKVKAVCASNSNANSAQSSTVSIKATKLSKN